MLIKLRDKLLLRKISKSFQKVLKKRYSNIITKYNLIFVRLIYQNLAKRYGMTVYQVYNCLPLTICIDKDLDAYGMCQSAIVEEKKLFQKPIKRRKSTIFLNAKDVTTTTFIHEFGHYLRFLIAQVAYHKNEKAIQDFKLLVDILRSRANVVKNEYDNFFSRGYFTEEEEENFAKSWEQYLKDGVSPEKKYQKIFNNFRKYVFQDMNSRSEKRKYEFYEDLQVKITPERKQFFDDLIIGKRKKKENIIIQLLEIYIYIVAFIFVFKYLNTHFIKIF